MFTADLIAGFGKEKITGNLCYQYIKREIDIYTSILYKNTKISVDLINIITE